MRTLIPSTAVLAFALVLAGCSSYGILYTRTVEPLTLNHLAAPVTDIEGAGDTKHIQLPYVGVMWGDNSFGSLAREKGLKEFYYADLEYLSVLGIWQQRTVHLYGR